jgi:hypothetical protein
LKTNALLSIAQLVGVTALTNRQTAAPERNRAGLLCHSPLSCHYSLSQVPNRRRTFGNPNTKSASQTPQGGGITSQREARGEPPDRADFDMRWEFESGFFTRSCLLCVLRCQFHIVIRAAGSPHVACSQLTAYAALRLFVDANAVHGYSVLGMYASTGHALHKTRSHATENPFVQQRISRCCVTAQAQARGQARVREEAVVQARQALGPDVGS